ncbi:MAG: hypothetical protein IJ410_05400 [Oscillospiraceae bacterium]|nr:hypothetical protein [Oscillospiraceae bacterium]
MRILLNKKKLIELSAKWKYTWPAWTVVTIAILGTIPFGPTLLTLFCCTPVVIASFLFAANHWQGSFFGILFAIMPMTEYWYNCWLVEYKDMVIYHNWNPWVFTVMVIVYYIFMGWLCYRENNTSK